MFARAIHGCSSIVGTDGVPVASDERIFRESPGGGEAVKAPCGLGLLDLDGFSVRQRCSSFHTLGSTVRASNGCRPEDPSSAGISLMTPHVRKSLGLIKL